LRILGQHARVDLVGALELADPPQDHCVQVTEGRVAGLRGECQLDFPQRFGGACLAVQGDGVVVSGNREVGCQLEAARQQVAGVHVPAEAQRDLGEHADGGDVGRMLLEVAPEQRLGLGNPVPGQGGPGLEQPRVVYRGPDVLRPGRVGARAGHALGLRGRPLDRPAGFGAAHGQVIPP